MLRTTRSLALTLAVILPLLVMAGRAEAQNVVTRYYYPPTVTYYGPPPVVSYYQPPVVSYYAAPTVSYYAAPSVSYSPAPTVSYYAAPSVSYYAAPVATTTRYGLFGRQQVTSYYYAPVLVYP